MINRVNNEGDSLGAFHLRIAAFDAGCANATAGQAINREKGWGKEKGWGISIALLIQSLDRIAHPT